MFVTPLRSKVCQWFIERNSMEKKMIKKKNKRKTIRTQCPKLTIKVTEDYTVNQVEH